VRRASAIVGILHSSALRLLFATFCMMSIIGSLLQRGPDLFYSDCFSAIFSADRRLLICFVADSHLVSAPCHLAVHLIFSSLRSIRPGCCMPSDSFIHSGFRFLLWLLTLARKELLHCRGRYFSPLQKFGCLSRPAQNTIVLPRSSDT
jgi:hypothetical protein